MTTAVEPLQEWGMDRLALGSRLRARRIQAGLSQKGLADRIGEPQPNVARWETGKMEVPGSLLPDICEALGITIEQLFDEPPVVTPLRPGPKPKSSPAPPRPGRRRGPKE